MIKEKWEVKLYDSGTWGVRQTQFAPSAMLNDEIISCGFAICNVVDNGDETEANAHLIAAAPELLDACKKVIKETKGLTPSDYIHTTTMNQIQAAINSAESQ